MHRNLLILRVWAPLGGGGDVPVCSGHVLQLFSCEPAKLQVNSNLLRLGNVHVRLQPSNQLFINEIFRPALTGDFVEPPGFAAPSVLTRLVKPWKCLSLLLSRPWHVPSPPRPPKAAGCGSCFSARLKPQLISSAISSAVNTLAAFTPRGVHPLKVKVWQNLHNYTQARALRGDSTAGSSPALRYGQLTSHGDTRSRGSRP